MKLHSFRSTFLFTLLPALSVGLAASSSAFNFTNVIDTTMTAPGGGAFSSFGSIVGIGNGYVTGSMNYSGSTGVGSGIYRHNGVGNYTTIAKVGDAAPSGTFSGFSQPGMSANGNSVYFRGTYGSSEGLFSSTGGVITTHLTTGSPAPIGTFTTIGNPRGDAGKMSFNGTFNGGNSTGIFTVVGTTATALNVTGDAGPGGAFSGFGTPASSGGNTAYQGSTATSRANYIHNGTTRTTVMTLGDSVTGFGIATDIQQPAISGSTLAFQVLGAGNTGAIVKGTAGNLTVLAKTGQAAPVGLFTGFSSRVSIANDDVVFLGNYTGGSGVFLSDNGVLKTVIKTGDSLFGSTVTTLLVSTESIDDLTNVAFSYTLANGVSGVAFANEAVPEPGTVFGIVALAGLVAKRRLRNRKA